MRNDRLDRLTLIIGRDDNEEPVCPVITHRLIGTRLLHHDHC